jgi:hypothetical protein
MLKWIENPSRVEIDWEFQVEQQGFITRYGKGGGFRWKQVVLQPGHMIPVYPIKRIDVRVFETAKNLSKILE